MTAAFRQIRDNACPPQNHPFFPVFKAISVLPSPFSPMSASSPSIPYGGLLLNCPPSDQLEEGDDCAYAPHYFFPLADWHLKEMAEDRIVDIVAANLYILGVRPKNAVPRQPHEPQPTTSLTENDWFVNSEQIYLALDEAKRQGDSRYKAGHLVRIYACPALVFITDEHYFPVLDLNTPNPFAGLYHLIVEEGRGLPKTVGKLGKLLAMAERSQARGQWFLKGVVAREQVDFEGLSLDTVRKPRCLAYTRQYVKIRQPAGGLQEPESNPAKARRHEEAKWGMGVWDVSAEHLFTMTDL